MAIEKFEKNMAIVSGLDDEPNDVGGLSAVELKAKFDEGGEALKAYINNTLIPGIVREVSAASVASILDGSIPQKKLEDAVSAAIDRAKADGEIDKNLAAAVAALTESLSEKPNPNLLDNWYFGNPVNQRGITDGNIVNAYWIDRWKILNIGRVSLKDGHITITADQGYDAYVQQELDFEPQFPYTMSILTPDGILVHTFNGFGVFQFDNGVRFEIGATKYCHAFIPINTSLSIKAVKLELGDKQTLALQDENGNWVLNEIPDYGEQLAKCQMRQIVLDASPGFAVGRCFKTGDTTGALMIPVPCSFGNGNVAVVATGDFRNVGYNVYAEIPSSALSTTGRVMGGMCVIDINANVGGDGMLDSGDSARIILDRNL